MSTHPPAPCPGIPPVPPSTPIAFSGTPVSTCECANPQLDGCTLFSTHKRVVLLLPQRKSHPRILHILVRMPARPDPPQLALVQYPVLQRRSRLDQLRVRPEMMKLRIRQRHHRARSTRAPPHPAGSAACPTPTQTDHTNHRPRPAPRSNDCSSAFHPDFAINTPTARALSNHIPVSTRHRDTLPDNSRILATVGFCRKNSKPRPDPRATEKNTPKSRARSGVTHIPSPTTSDVREDRQLLPKPQQHIAARHQHRMRSCAQHPLVPRPLQIQQRLTQPLAPRPTEYRHRHQRLAHRRVSRQSPTLPAPVDDQLPPRRQPFSKPPALSPFARQADTNK
jgi:hypothetical protein